MVWNQWEPLKSLFKWNPFKVEFYRSLKSRLTSAAPNFRCEQVLPMFFCHWTFLSNKFMLFPSLTEKSICCRENQQPSDNSDCNASLNYMIYKVRDYLFRDSKQIISKLSLNYHLKAYFLIRKQNYHIWKFTKTLNSFIS